MYYGGEDKFDKPVTTYKYISKILGIPLMTVCYMINQFKRSGYNFNLVDNKRGKFGMLSLEV